MTELERELAREHCHRWRRSRKAPLEILAGVLTAATLLLLIASLAHAESTMEPLSRDGHMVDSPPPPPWAHWKQFWCGGARQPASSGNHAFDEYRAETLRRLEEEQKEFTSFLDRLRFAKDKAEFDQFMAERRAPRAPSAESEPPPAS